jgi:hypothetical protein
MPGLDYINEAGLMGPLAPQWMVELCKEVLSRSAVA